MSEKRKFRNHISVVLEQTAGVIVAIAVLAVTQFLDHIDEILKADLSFLTEKGVLIVSGVILLLTAAVAAQLLVWRKTYISFEESAIVVEKGSVNKRKNTIGISSISNINLEQNLIEMMFGTCKVKFDTNSRSTADSTDVKIVLKKADARWFRQEVERRIEMNGRQNLSPGAETDELYDVHADFQDVLRHGAFSVSAVSAAVFIFAIIGTVMSIIETVRRVSLFGAAAGGTAGIAVAFIIAASAFWDTLKDFIRYYDFRVKRSNDKLYIRYGFLKKAEYIIPVDKIQALRIRQSMVARIGRRYMAEIINIGMGDDKEEKNSFLILYCTEEELRRQVNLLLPEYAEALDVRTEGMPAAVWAAWSIPFGLFLICLSAAAAAAGCAVPEKYIRLIWCGTAAAAVLTPLCMFLKYRTAGTGADGRFLKTADGYFGRQYLCALFRNIQYVEFSGNPIARHCGICRGTMYLLASLADTAQSIPYFRSERMNEIRDRILER